MYYEYDNVKIYYKKYGNSKNTILILPGWGNTRQTFQAIINHFKNDYTIYILDYPSFGKSPTPNKELDIFDYALLIKTFMKKNNIIKPIIIAHSFGGRITSILQGYYKIPISKIVLFDVAGIKRINIKLYLKQKIYKLLKLLINVLPKNKQLKYKRKLLIKFSSEDYNNIPSIMKKTFQNIINKDLRLYYKNISVETLLIWGEKDKATPLKDAYTLNEIIKNSGLIIYKNSGHFSYLDNPILTIRILEELFKTKKA